MHSITISMRLVANFMTRGLSELDAGQVALCEYFRQPKGGGQDTACARLVHLSVIDVCDDLRVFQYCRKCATAERRHFCTTPAYPHGHGVFCMVLASLRDPGFFVSVVMVDLANLQQICLFHITRFGKIEFVRVKFGLAADRCGRVQWDGMSRIHSKILGSGGDAMMVAPSGEKIPSSFRIVDCGASNGTFVNNVRVSESILRSGDTISFGRGSGCRVSEVIPERHLEYIFVFRWSVNKLHITIKKSYPSDTREVIPEYHLEHYSWNLLITIEYPLLSQSATLKTCPSSAMPPIFLSTVFR